MTLKFRTIIALAASAALLSSCATAATEPASPPAPLVVRGASLVVELAAVRLAVENLYPPGTTVEHGGVDTLSAAENPSDLATNAETQLLIHSVAHPDLRAILLVAKGHYRIVARKSAGIESITDLRGKRIGTVLTGSSGYFLSKMLKTEGMTVNDVVIHNIWPFTGLPDALAKGEVDAISIWEPQSENAARALGADVTVLPGTGIYFEYFNLNSTAAVLADPGKRARVVEFIRALIEANEQMNKDPRHAQELVATAGNYTVDEVANSWKHHTFEITFPDDLLDVLVEEEVWLAGVQKRTPRTRDELAKLIDRSVFDEAMAAYKAGKKTRN